MPGRAYVIGHLVPSDPVHLDDLCPDCLLPGLWSVTFHILRADSVGVFATGVYCDSCGRRRATMPS